jgi:hypothetical protein
VIASDRESLDEELGRWRSFEECLFHDIRIFKYGFGFDLIFNVIRTNGAVRMQALSMPALVTCRLLGVESISFVGGLTDAMKADPERINWGLSEISRVEQIDVPSRLGLSVLWEGPRRLDAEFLGFEVFQTQ